MPGEKEVKPRKPVVKCPTCLREGSQDEINCPNCNIPMVETGDLTNYVSDKPVYKPKEYRPTNFQISSVEFNSRDGSYREAGSDSDSEYELHNERKKNLKLKKIPRVDGYWDSGEFKSMKGLKSNNDDNILETMDELAIDG